MADPAKPQLTAAMLGETRLFHGLDAGTLERLVAELPAETALPGKSVITEGEVTAHLFAIVHGELEVLTKGGGSHDVRVALLGPGDWFGEMAILDVQPRSATVRALAPSLMLRMTAADVQRLVYEPDVKQYALLLMNIARELSRRLRVADRLIASASEDVAQEYVQQSMRPPSG